MRIKKPEMKVIHFESGVQVSLARLELFAQKKLIVPTLKRDVVALSVLIKRNYLCSSLPKTERSQQSDRWCVVQGSSRCNSDCTFVFHNVKN